MMWLLALGSIPRWGGIFCVEFAHCSPEEEQWTVYLTLLKEGEQIQQICTVNVLRVTSKFYSILFNLFLIQCSVFYCVTHYFL